MTRCWLDCANEVSFSAELLCIASLSGLKISWMAVPPTGIVQAAALPKRKMVCRWQKMRFRQPLQPWEGRGQEGAFPSSSPTTNSVGPATAYNNHKPRVSPKFFPCNPVVSLGVGRGILFPQSPARLEHTSCNLCWGKGEGGQLALAAVPWRGQWCVKRRTGHIRWQQFRSFPKTHVRVWFWDQLCTLVFWCWWRLMQRPETCAELLF